MSDRKIVFITGNIGSGKSYLANHLVSKENFKLLKFAGPIKEMLKTLGLSESQIEGDDKNQNSDLLCGNSPRYAMQTLGTEWGRTLIGKSIWSNIIMDKIEESTDHIVCDDLRFISEYEDMLYLNPTIIRVYDKKTRNNDLTHGSESEINEIPADLIIENDKSNNNAIKTMMNFLS